MSSFIDYYERISDDENIYVLKPNGKLFATGHHRSRQSYLMLTSDIGDISEFDNDNYYYPDVFPDISSYIHGGITWHGSVPYYSKKYTINGHNYYTDNYSEFTIGYDYCHFGDYKNKKIVNKKLMDYNLHNLMKGFYGYYISNNEYLREYYQFTIAYILMKLLKLYQNNRLIIEKDTDMYILKLLQLGCECADVYDIIIKYIQETDQREYLLELYKENIL